MIDPHLPLIDLHRHLDGSVRLETILELGLEHNLPLPAKTLEGLRPYVQVTTPQPGLLEYFKRFEWLTKILVDYPACRRIAYENVEDAARAGIDYIELRFSPWFMAEANQLDPAGVVEAVVDGVQAGERDFGVRAALTGILSRTYGPETCRRELEVLLAQRRHFSALDLAGDEIHFPPELFVEHFKRGREAGWHITVHAGEAAGPENIWQAIRLLGAERIGHATRALEDPRVVEYMAEHKIGVETNLTSNVQISAVRDYASHPLKTFLEGGVLATINTDDPGISAIDLAHEYNVAAPAAGCSKEQIRQLQMNALEIAFISPLEKEQLRRKKAI